MASNDQPILGGIMPFFIVDNLEASVNYYRKNLGFSVTVMLPEDDPFFAMVSRDNVTIMLKAITPEIHPTPNHTRHEWAPWDAYIYTPNPDALYEEFSATEAIIHQPLANIQDGLRGFEIKDHDGYVICFARLLN